MKPSRFAAVLFTAALSAAAVPAFGASSLLTPGGVRYAIVPDPDRAQVQIARAQGDLRATLVAPTTQDAERESQTQLAYDTATGTLYVVWVRDNAGNAEIRFASLNVDGEWSDPRMVAAGSGAYRDLQFVLTHAESDGQTATLLHLAWWSVNGRVREPEYAMFAFENGVPVSAQVANLDELAGLNGRVQTTELEYEYDAIHPPMAMARNGEGVDVAFGAVGSSVLTRLNVTPRKVGGNVRIWKPLGRTPSRTPRAGVMLTTGTPVTGVIINGRLALYSVTDEFRFVVLRSDNTWSEVHAVRLDAENTVDELIRDLRHTVQELLDHESQAAADSAAAER